MYVSAINHLLHYSIVVFVSKMYISNAITWTAYRRTGMKSSDPLLWYILYVINHIMLWYIFPVYIQAIICDHVIHCYGILCFTMTSNCHISYHIMV